MTIWGKSVGVGTGGKGIPDYIELYYKIQNFK